MFQSCVPNFLVFTCIVVSKVYQFFFGNLHEGKRELVEYLNLVKVIISALIISISACYDLEQCSAIISYSDVQFLLTTSSICLDNIEHK